MLEIRQSEILKMAEQFVLYKLDVRNKLCWLFDIEEGTCFNLNESSFFILSCFDGETPVSEIRQKFISRYPNESPEKLSKDFEELLKTLKERRVLV